METPFVMAGAFVLSLLLTGAYRRYAVSRKVLDRPNPRSLHETPTPRGGGIGIVGGYFVGLVFLVQTATLPIRDFFCLLTALAVAIVGLVDDHRSIAARWRLLVQIVAAVGAVVSVGGVPQLYLGGRTIHLGMAGSVVAVVGIVWLCNLYNFMDGIDWIAGVEALNVGVASSWLGWSFFPGIAQAFGLIASASGGFLIWNMLPLRVFMGDVGSVFLGFAFGTLGLLQASKGSIWPMTILLGYFIADATVTLLARILRGERWYMAHRSHAYQHAARRWGHRKVVVVVFLINAAWLTPWAYVATRWARYEIDAVAAAIVPLVILVYLFRAGRADGLQ